VKKPEFVTVNEQKRTYFFPDGETVSLEGVSELAFSPGGYHLLNCNDGSKHIVAKGWLHIDLVMDDWTLDGR